MRHALFVMLLLLSSAAHAGAPIPPRKAESLESLQQKLAAEKERKQELDRKAADLAKNLGEIKEGLVETASEVRSREKALQKLETQIAALQKKKAALVTGLDSERQSLASLIVALERIRRLPPETLLARPGAPAQTARAATLMGAILPELNRRAEELRVKLDELNAVEADLVDNQTELKGLFEKLRGEQTKMDALLASRSKTYSRAQADIKSQQAAVDAASREAANFQDLIARLEEKNRKRATASAAIPGKAIESVPLPGSAQLPVSGIIKERYGQKDEIGAASEGLRIEARADAVVVAPMGGIVRYAGPFKAYGNIVLLEHKDNYHSLIAGLGRIDTVVGQSVDSGEPVGNLGAQAGERPVLYYELRHKGQPVNPARKFSDLAS